MKLMKLDDLSVHMAIAAADTVHHKFKVEANGRPGFDAFMAEFGSVPDFAATVFKRADCIKAFSDRFNLHAFNEGYGHDR